MKNIELDIEGKTMVWKYQDEQHKLGDILVDSTDVYNGLMMVGGNWARVYIA